MTTDFRKEGKHWYFSEIKNKSEVFWVGGITGMDFFMQLFYFPIRKVAVKFWNSIKIVLKENYNYGAYYVCFQKEVSQISSFKYSPKAYQDN